MRQSFLLLLPLVLLVGCGPAKPTIEAATLPEAKKGFVTQLSRQEKANEPVEVPPRGVFDVVQYTSPAGSLAAYLTPDPKDGKKHAAIVWITGGDCNTIGDVWKSQPQKNDQTAAAYRKAGLVMMFPSLRGGNTNPGVKEGFLGEVDDILAATDYLAKLPYVDTERIYLGGHSTGGTMVLLVAASSERYKAVFSFGPVADVGGYPDEYAPWKRLDRKETEIRSPGRWVNTIRVPTFVFEGTKEGNVDELRKMAKASTNDKVKYLALNGADHFSVLGPVNSLLAQKLAMSDGRAIDVTEAELNALFGK